MPVMMFFEDGTPALSRLPQAFALLPHSLVNKSLALHPSLARPINLAVPIRGKSAIDLILHIGPGAFGFLAHAHLFLQFIGVGQGMVEAAFSHQLNGCSTFRLLLAAHAQ
jgi:hypothetical protein